MYDIDEVRCLTGLPAALAMLSSMRIAAVYNLPNQVSSGVKLNPEKADAVLHKTVIGTCRVVKDEYEVAMIQKANHISSLEHEVVMCPIQDSSNEMQAGSIFQGRLVEHSAKKMAYSAVATAGQAVATLNHEANDGSFEAKQSLLLDAGCEWNNRVSDVVGFFPLP